MSRTKGQNQELVTIPINTHIEMVSINKVYPYFRNAKRHTKKQITSLARHIRNVGWDQPIVVDEDNVILKGHGRLMAARELKMTHVPVMTKVGLTDTQKISCRIADNKLNESEWDLDLLNMDLTILKEDGFDMTQIGITAKDAEALMKLDNLSEFSEPYKKPKKKEAIPENIICPHCGEEFQR